jgi:hypothetical protein
LALSSAARVRIVAGPVTVGVQVKDHCSRPVAGVPGLATVGRDVDASDHAAGVERGPREGDPAYAPARFSKAPILYTESGQNANTFMSIRENLPTCGPGVSTLVRSRPQ